MEKLPQLLPELDRPARAAARLVLGEGLVPAEDGEAEQVRLAHEPGLRERDRVELARPAELEVGGENLPAAEEVAGRVGALEEEPLPGPAVAAADLDLVAALLLELDVHLREVRVDDRLDEGIGVGPHEPELLDLEVGELDLVLAEQVPLVHPDLSPQDRVAGDRVPLELDLVDLVGLVLVDLDRDVGDVPLAADDRLGRRRVDVAADPVLRAQSVEASLQGRVVHDEAGQDREPREDLPLGEDGVPLHRDRACLVARPFLDLDRQVDRFLDARLLGRGLGGARLRGPLLFLRLFLRGLLGFLRGLLLLLLELGGALLLRLAGRLALVLVDELDDRRLDLDVQVTVGPVQLEDLLHLLVVERRAPQVLPPDVGEQAALAHLLEGGRAASGRRRPRCRRTRCP